MCHTWFQRGCGKGAGAAWRAGNWWESKVRELCGEWDTWDNEVGNKDLTGGQGSYRLKLDGLQEKRRLGGAGAGDAGW